MANLWRGCCVALVLCAGLAGAQPAAGEVPAVPAVVTVGVYVNQVHEFSLKDNSFTVDFFIWFRWKDPQLRPYETWSLVDGRIDSQTEAVVKELPDGSRYAYSRVVGKITKFFDVTDYPLDNHNLTIIVEEDEHETHRVVYAADETNSAASPSILLPGWRFARLSTVAEASQYRSNFGDTSLPTGNGSAYARLTTAVSFTRSGTTYFLKLFFALVVCVVLAMTAFFIRPTDVDPRFGVGVGALFGAIASQYTVAGTLPETNVVTLADKLHLEAFLVIILSVAQSTWALWLYENERLEQAARLDRWARRVIPLAYVVGFALLVATR